MRASVVYALAVFVVGIFSGLLLAKGTQHVFGKTGILQSVPCSFTGPGERNHIQLIQPKSGSLKENYIVIFNSDFAHQIWRSPVAPIWKIAAADVDGDGKDELALCLYKSEPHDPKKNNRLQIYAWGRNGIYAKWRGTFLGRPFLQTEFADANQDGTVELITLEKWEDKKYLSAYVWNGFGFDLVAQVSTFSKAEVLMCEDLRNKSDKNWIISVCQAETPQPMGRYALIGNGTKSNFMEAFQK